MEIVNLNNTRIILFEKDTAKNFVLSSFMGCKIKSCIYKTESNKIVNVANDAIFVKDNTVLFYRNTRNKVMSVNTKLILKKMEQNYNKNLKESLKFIGQTLKYYVELDGYMLTDFNFMDAKEYSQFR